MPLEVEGPDDKREEQEKEKDEDEDVRTYMKDEGASNAQRPSNLQPELDWGDHQ